MGWLTNFGYILWAMLEGYLRHGWFFAITHISVFFFLYRSWRSVSEAAEELESWHPQTRAADPGENPLPEESLKLVPRTSQPVNLLDLYVAESEKMGAQGAFVPMTDYSDRLDSIIDGLISELQDRTNLFLIVGIAGTLFGLFEFAFLSYAELQRSAAQPGGQLLNLGKFLSQSMSKAFPVGFMGLALTFAAQLWSARPEGRLRAALASAARRALERRKEASVSQVQSLQEAVTAMQKAMQPLENLSSTLSKGLEPVANTFGNRLDELLDLVKGQFNQLQQTTQSLHETIVNLQNGVSSFGAVTTRVEDLFLKFPAMLDSLVALQDRQRDSIESFNKQVKVQFQEAQNLGAALQEAIQNFGQLPQQMTGDFRNAFIGLGGQALNTWDNYSESYTKNLQTVYQNFLFSINDSADGVKKALNEAANEWQRYAQNADHLLKDPMNKLFTDLRKDLAEDLRKLDQVVAQRYPNAANDIIGFTQRLESLIEQTNQLQSALTVWLEGARQSGMEIQTINSELIQTLSRISATEHSGAAPRMIQLLESSAKQTWVVGQSIREMQAQLANLESSIYEELQIATKHLAGLRRDINQNFLRRWFRPSSGRRWFGLFSKHRDNPGTD